MSPSNNTRVSSPSFQCPHCTKAFSRPSHLDRHRLTHLPRNLTTILPCSRCDKSFSRRDVLIRHLRACHLIEQPTAKRSMRKSCRRCVVKKRKCERARPCEGCVKSHVSCEYTSPEPEDSILDNIDISRDFSDCSRPPPPEQGRQQVNHFIFVDPSSGMGSVTTADDRSLAQTLQTPPTSNSGEEPALSSCHSRSQDRSFHSLLAEFSPTSSSAPGIFNVSQPVTDEAFTDANGFMPINGETLSLNFSASTPPNFHTSGLDWLNFDMPNFSIDSEPWVGAGIPSAPDLEPPSVLNQEDAGATDRAVPPYLSQQSAHPTVMGQLRTVVNSPSLQPLDSNYSGQPWPFDQARDSIPHRYSLPPLRDILKSTSISQNKRLGSLIPFLSDSYLPSRASVKDTNTLQAFGELQRLLDLYFTRFHDIQPIIHRPSWNMFSCQTVLLTSMACVGALLSDDEQDAELSWMLSEICLPMVTWSVGQHRIEWT